MVDQALISLPPNDPGCVNEKHKLESICAFIRADNLILKTFIIKFLNSHMDPMLNRQQFWNTECGLDSTMRLVEAIKNLVDLNNDGFKHWYDLLSDLVGGVVILDLWHKSL